MDNYEDLRYEPDRGPIQRLTGWIRSKISNAVQGRKKQIRKHLINKKRWARRLGTSLTGVGAVIGLPSFILGLVSIVINKDVDVVDMVFCAIISPIPVLNKLAPSEEEKRRMEIDRRADKSRRGQNSEGRSLLAVAGVLMVLIMFLAVIPGLANIAGVSENNVLVQYTDYYIGGTFDRIGMSQAVQPITGEISYQGSQALGFLSCVGEGPHCLREHQLNQTERPGSESVGREFGLNIRSFDVGAGDSIDVAFSEPDQTIPISYDIYNTRHGLRGIEAMNVSYRVTIDDGSEVQCDTGWTPVDGFDIEEDGLGTGNDLIPGSSAAQGFVEHEELTLKNCGMIQPGAREMLSANLDIRYDYFSQSTLNFEAMSEQARQSEQIDIRQISSVTADTPVQAAMGVSSPATFDEATGESQQPVSVETTLETGESEVSYQVEDLEITPPSRTCIAADDGGCVDFGNNYEQDLENAQSCAFVPTSTDADGSYDTLELSEDQKANLMAGEDEDRGLPSDHWFDRDVRPSLFGCNFNLEDNHQVNPAGETMTMHVAANYTTRLEEGIGNFQAYNSLCSEHNCPIVVPLNLEEADQDEISDENDPQVQRATCEGVDAADGCGIDPEGGQVSPPDSNLDLELRRGEMALQLEQSTIEEQDFFTYYSRQNSGEAWSNIDDYEGIIALEPQDIITAQQSPGQAINITGVRPELVTVDEEEESEGGSVWSFIPGV